MVSLSVRYTLQTNKVNNMSDDKQLSAFKKWLCPFLFFKPKILFCHWHSCPSVQTKIEKFSRSNTLWYWIVLYCAEVFCHLEIEEKWPRCKQWHLLNFLLDIYFMYRHKEWEKELICSVLCIYFPANFKFNSYFTPDDLNAKSNYYAYTGQKINLGLQTVGTDLFHRSVPTRIENGPSHMWYLQNCSSADWDPYEA